MAQHIADDMFTVSTAPSCSNGQTGIPSPAPQTVLYNAGPVVVTNLGENILCRLALKQLICIFNSQ